MSRKLLAFLLSELSVVRVKCKKCGSVLEVEADKIESVFTTCPLCKEKIVSSSGAFTFLASAMKAFKEQSATVEIEFVIPDRSAE